MDVQVCAHAQGCARAKEKPYKALRSRLWLTLNLCVSRK